MLDGMTTRQLNEWVAYYSIEPFGEDRRDLGTAIVAQTMAACWARKVPDIWRFMPLVKRPPVDPEKRMENSKAAVRKFLRAMSKGNG